MMKILFAMLICAVTALWLPGKDDQPGFTEIVIDKAAPEHLWMKTTGDINSDGKLDILVGGWQKGGLVAYLAPEWTKQVINQSLKISTNAEVCDIDKNRIPDIVAVVNQAVVWLAGPDWELHHIDSVVAHDVEVRDFDNDGLLDIVARNQGAFGEHGGDTLYFYKQENSWTWTRYTKEIPDGEGLKTADINNDGRQDIVTNAYWFENKGTIDNWKGHKFTDTWTWPNAYIDIADINNDGRLDILHSPAELAKNYYRISWFQAPADVRGRWKEHIVADSIETVLHSIGAADFDSDGNMDIITAEMQQGADPDEVAIFYNKGSNTWDKHVISTSGCHSMQIFDADQDGDLDVFGANFVENIVRLWVNQQQQK